MTTISVRFDEEVREELEELGRRKGLSVSEVIRQAVETRLGRNAEPNWPAPRTMSKPDRHVLVLLHEILQQLAPDEAEYHRRQAEVLARGYTGNYDDEFVGIDDELALADCRLLWDILDMFRVLKASIADIGDEALARIGEDAEIALTFAGFDLSDEREGQMLGYARHLVDNDRWTDLAEHFDATHDRGNSHLPLLSSYQHMLEAFQPIWRDVVHAGGRRRYVLSEAELAQVVEAWQRHG